MTASLATAFVATGAFLLGVGATLSGIAALRALRKRNGGAR